MYLHMCKAETCLYIYKTSVKYGIRLSLSLWVCWALCLWPLHLWDRPLLLTSTIMIQVEKSLFNNFPVLYRTFVLVFLAYSRSTLCIFPLSTNWLNVSVSGALNCLFQARPGGLCRVLVLHLIQCVFTDHCLGMKWAPSCVLVIGAVKSSYLVPSKTDNQWKEKERER